MKCIAAAAVLALGVLPAMAEEAAEGPIDASFTWTSIDLASMPAAEGGKTYLVEAHLVVTSNVGGPIDKLGGRCLIEGTAHGDDWQSTGSCTLVDGDGDLLFERIEETGSKGKGMFEGGTGKFAGITGVHELTSTWFASPRDGENQGIGTKKGEWKRPAM